MKAVAVPLNPCPGIYYEEAFNRTSIVPQGCPPNAATQILLERGELQQSDSNLLPGAPTSTIQPPLPETQEAPIATVVPVSGQVDVVIQNNTNAVIAYQAIGYTEEQYIEGQATETLQDLPVPVTVTVYREDEGLLQIVPTPNPDTGTLEVTLEEKVGLGENQGALRVQPDGQVLVN